MLIILKTIIFTVSLILAAAAFAQVETYPPTNKTTITFKKAKSGVGRYRLRRNKIYIGFYARKNSNENGRLYRESGTAIAHYNCINNTDDIRKVIKNLDRYKNFSVELEENNDCKRRIRQLELYSAKFNQHITINLLKTRRDLNEETFRLVDHANKKGIFIRAIFNRQKPKRKAKLESITSRALGYFSYPFIAKTGKRLAQSPFYQKVKSEHYVAILDRGAAALYKRLEMIKNAKESIELLTYIYSPEDVAGRLISQALARKAKEGIRVRLVIDRNPFGFEMKKEFTTALIRSGVEVKLHNDNFWKINPWQVRNHQKMLIVDGKQLLTGGRNISSAYYGLNKKQNFVDRDIWIFGAVAKVALKSFNLSWHNDILKTPTQTNDWNRNFLVQNSNDSLGLKKINRIGAKQLENETPVLKVKSATFVSDRPGSNNKSTRVVSHFLYNVLRKNINQEVLIEAPYFLMLREGRDVLDGLLEKGVPLSLLTNSRYSIGASHIPMAYILEKLNKEHVKDGVKVYGYSGLPMPNEEIATELELRTPTELHGKSMVIGDSVFIGSYNLDPRSKYFNVEMGVYFENEPELAALMFHSYTKIVNNSLKMKDDGKYQNSYIFDEIRRRRSGEVDDKVWLTFKSVMMDITARELL